VFIAQYTRATKARRGNLYKGVDIETKHDLKIGMKTGVLTAGALMNVDIIYIHCNRN
jgi:hypothetical protein